jgi:hypothetical protein
LIPLLIRHLIILIVHLITTVLRVVRPSGVRAVVAESILETSIIDSHQSRRRGPKLCILDRLIAGSVRFGLRPKPVSAVAIGFKPYALSNFHRALVRSIGYPIQGKGPRH